MTTILACDLGGSGLRAALVTETGAFAGETFVPLPVPLDGATSEVDPDLWWGAFETAAGRLRREAAGPFAAVAAVAICGMTRTQVFLDTSGRPVRPAITWRDTRAAGVAARLADVPGEVLDAFHPLARLAFVAEHEPESAKRIARIVEPKDYLALRLTGRAAGDPISLARLASEGSRANHDALPDLLEPGTVVAAVRSLGGPLAGLAGKPVVMASHDTWAAVVGLGAMRPGLAYNISGTSEVLGLMTDRPADAAGLLRVAWGRNLWQLGGPSQNGADVVPWLARITGTGAGEAFDALLAGPRASSPVIFLPFLAGERTPYWDSALRAAFLGLSRAHGPTDLAYAVLEGAAHAAKVILDRAEAATGLPAREVRIGGGGSRSAVWRQIKADVLGRPVVMGASDEPGLSGCAALAFAALGTFRDLAEAQETLFAPAAVHEPNPEAHAAHRHLHTLYEAAVEALAPLSRALQGCAPPPLALEGVSGDDFIPSPVPSHPRSTA